MPNIFELVTKYSTEAIDKVFAVESKSAILNNGSKFMDLNFNEVGYVKLATLLMDGLSDYHRANRGIPGDSTYANYPTQDGYKLGNAELTWDIYKLRYDRGKQFRVDNMDNEESAAMVIANILVEFTRTKVVPEKDAVTFSTLASQCSLTLGNLKNETIAPNTILGNLNSAFTWLTELEVPAEDQVVFVNPETMLLIQNTSELVRYLSQSEYKNGDVSFKINTYMGRPLIEVPTNRFYTDVQVGENGCFGTVNSKAINYIVCSKKCVVPITKLEKSKIWTPEMVQDFDGYKVNYRTYYDVIVPKNKIAGIYTSVSEVASSTKVNKLLVDVKKQDNGFVVDKFFTVPHGIIADKMVYSKDALTVGTKFASNPTNNKQITNGVVFTKLASETDGYFALVDSGDNVLAVSDKIKLPVA